MGQRFLILALIVTFVALAATALGLGVDRLQDSSFDESCWYDRDGYVIVGWDPHEESEVRYCIDNATQEPVATR